MTPVTLNYYGHLITKEKIEDDEKIDDFINTNRLKNTLETSVLNDLLHSENECIFSLTSVDCWADVSMLSVPDGKMLQFERK